MKHCAFLTMESMSGYVNDDELAIDPLRRLNWNVSMVPWRDKQVSWDSYDLVIIRSTWDYYDDPTLFLHVLKHIQESNTRLENSLDIISWNLNKKYLKDLEDKGILIVPTRWGSSLNSSSWTDIMNAYAGEPFIIKPVISANAEDTFLVKPSENEDKHQTILQTFSEKEYMVQPFVKSVVEEGEYSLFFFNGDYSHSILKTPKKKDFRVQEEHGGRIVAIQPSSRLVEQARNVLKAIDQSLLYARVDLVKNEKGDYALMELELIEPSLYLRKDPDAPARFAKAIHSLF